MDLLAHDDELVAAEPGDGVGVAYGVRQVVGDCGEERVAGVVAEGVVDPLHVVEVEEEHGDVATVALGPGEGLPEPVEQQPSVREPGEAVVQGGVQQPTLDLAGGGDVLAGGEAARSPVAVDHPYGREPDADLGSVGQRDPSLGTVGRGLRAMTRSRAASERARSSGWTTSDQVSASSSSRARRSRAHAASLTSKKRPSSSKRAMATGDRSKSAR